MIVQRQIFTEIECDQIINLIKENQNIWENSDRRYESKSIFYNEKTKWIFDKMVNFFQESTHHQILELKKEIHFHTYNKGDWFGKHNDTRDRRVYSVGALLNSDFDGGDFKIYTPQETTLTKNAGNAYVFDVTYEHEITRITNGIKYSIIWFVQDNHIKIKQLSII